MHYDPRIRDGFGEITSDVDMFDTMWLPISASVNVHLLRGAESDILPIAVVEKMQSAGPGLASYHVFDQIGHAPALMNNDQIEAIIQTLA